LGEREKEREKENKEKFIALKVLRQFFSSVLPIEIGWTPGNAFGSEEGSEWDAKCGFCSEHR
jgi:hypothetical protein